MGDQYLSDKLQPLFKMVVWNARNKKTEQKDKVFAAAMKHIEDAGQITDSEVIRVLDLYAGEFADVGLADESDRLANLAIAARQQLPQYYARQGRQLEWWEQAEFVRDVPELPWLIRASRVQPGSGGGLGGFLCVCLLLFFVLGIPFSLVIQPIFKALRIDEGIPSLLFLLSLPLGAWLIYRWRDSRLVARGKESWCKLTEDGIEFSEPGHTGNLFWSDISNVRDDFDNCPDEDNSYSVTEIIGKNKEKIRISSQFYTDAEVRKVFGICKLRTR